MRIGNTVSKQQLRREEQAAADSMDMTVAEYRAKYAPWRLAHVPRIEEYGCRGRRRLLQPAPARVKVKGPPATMRARLRVYERDGGRCRYCGVFTSPAEHGQRMFTIDHVLPRSRGGSNHEDNLVTACFLCNHVKGNRTLEEAGMTLRELVTAR